MELRDGLLQATFNESPQAYERLILDNARRRRSSPTSAGDLSWRILDPSSSTGRR